MPTFCQHYPSPAGTPSSYDHPISQKPTWSNNFHSSNYLQLTGSNKFNSSDYLQPTCSNNFQPLDPQYHRVYAIAKGKSNHTGSGVADKDRLQGIATTLAKQETNCPCFDEMYALFGEKANITAMVTMDSSIITTSDFDYLDSDNQDSDSDSVCFISESKEHKPLSSSLRRTSTLANLIDRHDQDESLLGGIQSPDFVGLNPNLDEVFQPLWSTVENLESFFVDNPSGWDNIPIKSSLSNSPNNFLRSQQDPNPGTPSSVSTSTSSQKPLRLPSQDHHPNSPLPLVKITTSNQQNTQTETPDQPNKSPIAKRQAKITDNQDKLKPVHNSANPLPPIAAPGKAKSELKNPLAQALLTISQSKAQMYKATNKRELELEARMVENETKTLMRDMALDKHNKEQEEKKQKQEELAVSLQLAWDKERFLHKKEERVQDKHIKQMNRWLAEGESVADVRLLLEMSGLTQPKDASSLTQQ
ncbi:uncharacterized protein MELLADRAFT_110282 [Melampsora larici-populina 98AG31]|uniref:Uncharacterized protein n=1 Tax=Melampsora larici-populina (strain 98AG31 / pathotype 3-4-7) TaxID=747676 RepID=F4RZ96_MELLP|nr:uncharacterized protein MELLADRAFT_110282 [Melampsora larici-populina 98AG31]EGG02185.1 hypothetical protein MELLADRAFT_110282 [Melampsora larici-populina 98AG31]